jgi:hypothetical protein
MLSTRNILLKLAEHGARLASTVIKEETLLVKATKKDLRDVILP